MNEQPIETGDTESILPIVCPYCKKEIELNMVFSLLPPKDPNENATIPTSPSETKEEKEEDEPSEEEQETT